MTAAPSPQLPYRRSPLALAVLALLNYKPLHPYGVQRLIKDWGKDLVVNVGQRASLYKTMERLLAAGLIGIRETTRDQQYPERTVYELTEEGRKTALRWMAEMLAAPKPEYPEFPAALSFLPMLPPEEVAELLEQRLASLKATLANVDAEMAEAEAINLPRIVVLDGEYLRLTVATELNWVEGVLADLRTGRFTWSVEELQEVARAYEHSVEQEERHES
jgi:DNA-binding PadR family transcriptional regulator